MTPRIGITLGDPGSISPEILLKAFRQRLPKAEYILFGSRRVLLEHSKRLQIPFKKEFATVVDVDNVRRPYFGAKPDISGPGSIEYLHAAFRHFRSGKIDGLVTGPIHKESWHVSGYHFPGQTEFCARETGSKEYCMLMVSERFRIALLSTHLSLREALGRVRRKNILAQVRLIDREFRSLGFTRPRIGCAALNPHAGEGGAFGSEEKLEIAPALEQLRKEGICVEGPLAPEVIFRLAASRKSWDVVLAMYHDQAMIPLKLLDFEKSANVTVGLPLIRTSPDHGTAFDIAGKGIAHPGSMVYAIRIAVDWTRRRLRVAYRQSVAHFHK